MRVNRQPTSWSGATVAAPAAVARVLRKLRDDRANRTRADDDAEQAGQRFSAFLVHELERARRHERSFSLTRFVVSGAIDGSAVLDADWFDVRACDAAASVAGHPTVLWSESDGLAASSAIRRLGSQFPPGVELATRTVVFPTDGLSVDALIEALDDVEVVPFDPTAEPSMAVAGDSTDLTTGKRDVDRRSMLEAEGAAHRSA